MLQNVSIQYWNTSIKLQQHHEIVATYHVRTFVLIVFSAWDALPPGRYMGSSFFSFKSCQMSSSQYKIANLSSCSSFVHLLLLPFFIVFAYYLLNTVYFIDCQLLFLTSLCMFCLRARVFSLLVIPQVLRTVPGIQMPSVLKYLSDVIKSIQAIICIF